jgi:phenylpropionate dioxygenase-like ring-hydroxylating dioxygenase large terminal subunit
MTMNDDAKSPPKEAAARCPGVSWNDYAAGDTHPVPGFLLEDHYRFMGSEAIDASRYTSREFFQRELDMMWPNVWQFAARDEEMPDPGDTVVYENAGRSYVLARQADGSVHAMHNVCLHRGRKLRDVGGNVNELRCPFHGFVWKLDGTIKDIPCRWDFPHLVDSQMSLPQAEVARWQGYIFVRENPGGPTIEEYLEPLPTHNGRWAHGECVTSVWAGKIVRANWKVAAEAFMEAWHSEATHRQIVDFTGDANTKYNVYGDHVNLALTPFAVPSPRLGEERLDEAGVLRQMLKYNGRSAATGLKIDLKPGQTARQGLAEANRARLGETDQRDYSQVSDAEMVDAITYNVFPNFAPWGGFPPNTLFRWRPWPDQNTTLMEVRRLTRVPTGQPRPRSAPMRLLAADEPWASVQEMAVLGSVIDQDFRNLPKVQEGLIASKNGKVQLGNYQEIRIRQFQKTLDKYLSGDARKP